MQRTDNSRNIVGRQSAADDNRPKCVCSKRKPRFKARSRAWRTTVEKKCAAAVAPEYIHAKIGIHPKRLDHLDALDHRTVIRRFGSSTLDDMNTQRTTQH